MVKWLLATAAISLLLVRVWGHYSRKSPYFPGDRVKITASIDKDLVKIYQKEYAIVEGIAVPVPDDILLNYGDRIIAIGTVDDQVINDKRVRFGLILEDFSKLQVQEDIMSQINSLRRSLMFRLLRWLPADEGALAAGILLGGSDLMSHDLKSAYRKSGMLHIVAASGYNVSVVAGWTTLALARWISRRRLIYISILSIIFYVFLAGASPAVIRAGIMAMAAWTGKLLGREGDSLWLLVLAGWAMLIYNPGFLVDIGWQLSMAATAGIVWFNPVREFWASVAAQVAVMPLILHHFGNLSIVAPLANLLLLWLVPPIMQLAGVAVIFPPASWLVWPLLKLMNYSVTLLSSFSWSNLQTEPVGWWWVACYYGVILIVYEMAGWRLGFKHR